MASNAIVTLRLNPAALLQVHAAQLAAVKEVFELDIKPEAVTKSPVTPEGLQRNVELKRKHPGGTGLNRNSIDTEIVQGEKGVTATLFTQSGYGGYLEVGTSKMRAQPYLYPAFLKFVNKITELTGIKIRGTK